MKTFKRFLREMNEVEFFVSVLNAALKKNSQLRLEAHYDGAMHEGIIEEARVNNEHNCIIDYKMWSDSEQAWIPAVLFVYTEDLDDFTIDKDSEGREALVYEK